MDAPPSHLSGRRPVLIADQPSIARSTSDFVSPTSLSVSQSLASILNNPHSNDASWSIWWPSATITPEFAPISPPLSEVTFADFHLYLQSISNTYSRFEDILHHSTKETALDVGVSRGQGEALVACLREVPSLFFKEDFALEDGGTFKAACPFSPSESENLELQERLTQYLDVVEMHLVREIALRSDSFFEAQGQLEGLNGEIVAACVRIRELKEAIRILTVDLVGSAREVQEFSATRRSLVALQQKLTVILYVSEALSALKLLVAAGDCAGALDVIDDLQHLLDTDELVGLHCFRHLRDQLAVSLDSINSILSAEFLLAAIHDARAVESAILLNVKMRASGLTNGLEDEVELDDDESCILRDRLLPLIIGLLRTAKLPAVLRIYRDTLIAEMKAAIKTTVAELLPILLTRPSESDLVAGENTVDSEGGGSSLASKLRSLSCESFVQLLIAIFKVVQAHLIRAAGVKQVIEWIMGNLDGYYVADAVSSAVPHGGAAYVAADAQESNSLVALHVQYSSSRNTSKVPLIQRKANDGSSPNTSKNFRADVLRENTEAVFAACDAAHGRWAKLLGVRALLHPRLRRQEFLSIYNITQEFIAATEKIGGRLGYSIRGTLQSQSKAFVDFQHESRMTKIKAVLDQETWAAVDVPDEFQTIVASLSANEASWNSSELGSGNGISPVVDSEAQAEGTPILNEDNSMHQHGRVTSETLKYGGDGYHMVNCGLILLKMLSEYVDISTCLPALSSEVVQRVVELLKLFNTRTCQLVLGAGAMQVSGLKSITSKHLALASQIISFIYVIIPELRQVLFLKIPEARKGLLSSEIDRVAQDFRLHRDEIHTKLVQIMRERLFANLRKLPQIVESWNRPEDNDLQPSQFARAVTKEVTFLHRILSQTLLENDVQAIFRQVTQIFHSHITEAYSKLDVSTPQANNRLSRDVQHVLGCIRKLPSDNISIDGVPNFGLLDEFLAERFSAKVG